MRIATALAIFAVQVCSAQETVGIFTPEECPFKEQLYELQSYEGPTVRSRRIDSIRLHDGSYDMLDKENAKIEIGWLSSKPIMSALIQPTSCDGRLCFEAPQAVKGSRFYFDKPFDTIDDLHSAIRGFKVRLFFSQPRDAKDPKPLAIKDAKVTISQGDLIVASSTIVNLDIFEDGFEGQAVLDAPAMVDPDAFYLDQDLVVEVEHPVDDGFNVSIELSATTCMPFEIYYARPDDVYRNRIDRVTTPASGYSLELNETTEIIDTWTYEQQLKFTLNGNGLEEKLDFQIVSFGPYKDVLDYEIHYEGTTIPMTAAGAPYTAKDSFIEFAWDFNLDHWHGSIEFRQGISTLTVTRDQYPEVELTQHWDLNSSKVRNQTLSFEETYERTIETSELKVNDFRRDRYDMQNQEIFQHYDVLNDLVRQDWFQFPDSYGDYEKTDLSLGYNDAYIGRNDMRVSLRPLQLDDDTKILLSNLKTYSESYYSSRDYITSNLQGMLMCKTDDNKPEDYELGYCDTYKLIACHGHPLVTECKFHYGYNQNQYGLDDYEKVFYRKFGALQDGETLEERCFFADTIQCDFEMLEWDGSKTYASWDSDSADRVNDITLLDAAATEHSEGAAGGNSNAVTISVASGLCIVALGIYAAMRCGKKTVGDDFMRA